MSSTCVNICTIFDSAMELGAKVLVTSLLHSHKDIDCQLRIFLLHTDEIQHQLLNTDLPTNATIAYIKISNAPINAECRHPTYEKLNMFEELPSDIDRIIYLDADTIVTAPLIELALIKLGNCPLAACLDYPTVVGSRMWADYRIEFTGRKFRPLIFTKEVLKLRNSRRDYFNAGVMVIQRSAWKSIREKAIAFIAAHPPTPCKDQDALAYAVHGNFLRLHPSYNVLSNWLEEPQPKGFRFYRAWWEWQIIVKSWKHQPKIVHFAGEDKPWNKRSSSPLAETWWKYADMSQEGVIPGAKTPNSC